MGDVNSRASMCSGYLGRAWLAVPIFLLCLMLSPTAGAAKTYEGVGTFGGVSKAGDVSEEAQLGGVSGLAVNSTGAGGVAKGTVYAVANGNPDYVSRFEPTPGGLKFVEKWEIQDEGLPYGICGPAVTTESLPGSPTCPMSADAGPEGFGIAVNQSTGYVYVAGSVDNRPEGKNIINMYSANGSELITSFGEKGPGTPGTLPEETPEKIHTTLGWSTIAVNDAGEVFFFDYLYFDNFYHRLMVFKPKTPGDYTEYEYAGQSRDIAEGHASETNFPMRPVLDDEGNVYVAGEDNVERYDPAEPDKPDCTFSFPSSGIYAMTVNPQTGEPFFYSYQKRPRRIHQLSACEGGEFHETGEIEVAPERAELTALVFDPNRQLSAGRQPGVLYGAAPGPVPGVGKGQPGTSALGYIFAQPEERPPAIASVQPERVTSGSATLTALLDPRGFATGYVFRYLTDAAYRAQGESWTGAAEAPAGGAVLPPSGGSRRVEAALSGLEANTGYVFQLVASSNCAPTEPAKVCTTESPAVGFHTYPVESPGLSDGRAYELVSPPDKGTGQVLPVEPERSTCGSICKPGEISVRFPKQSSPDGGTVVYEGGPFGSDGALIENEYRARRTDKGWETTNLTPSQLTNRGGNGYLAFDPMLTVGLLKQSTPALTSGTPGEYTNFYRQDAVTPASLSALLGAGVVPSCAAGSGSGSLVLNYVGASTDLSRVFFAANDALTPEATGTCGEANLYEWAAGSLRAVNLPPTATTSVPGAFFGSGQMLSISPQTRVVVTHAISSDGSRVFFTGADGRLYARLDGTATLEVPSPGNCSSATPLAARVCFLTASEDGSRVLLSNGQMSQLNEAGDAYEAGPDLAAGNGGFLGISGQSDDLTHVYFVDTANLTGGEQNDQGSVAEAGKPNLYAWVDGSTRFVAVLAPSNGIVSSWAADPLARTAEASPAGRWLAFTSVAPLTANTGSCSEIIGAEVKSVPCNQVFLYDSQSGALRCGSCNPSGAKPAGSSFVGGSTGETDGYRAQPRYLSDSGRLFFDSRDRLVPGDTNGNAEDVYQFEPAGLGTCKQADHCLSLISSGRGSADSNFFATDETGDNVFFTTRDRLVNADKDEAFDLYDARVGGGFPEGQPPVECSGEACQQAGGSPSLPIPSSMGLTPEGNPKSAPHKRCKKGQVKRKGHCVKKHKNHQSRKGQKQIRRHGREGGNR